MSAPLISVVVPCFNARRWVGETLRSALQPCEPPVEVVVIDDGSTDGSGELVREQFQLVLPMKPLCRDDCKGLCSECGTNLNRDTCTCSHKWEDQRLAALRGLLDRSKEK